MNGNVTYSGIRKDLKWMHDIGIGGVNIIPVSLSTPQVVKHPLIYMTPGWKRAFRYAAHLVGHYDMGLSIDSSPGWSETGGPWVKPAHAMKKLVWSTTIVQGGRAFHGKLPLPPSNTGPFQDAPMARGILGKQKYAHLKFYRDALVIAYRDPVSSPRPSQAISSDGAVAQHSLSELSDANLTDGLSLISSHGRAWIQIQYPKDTLVQAVTLAAGVSGASNMDTVVYVSRNGVSWKRVARIGLAKEQLGKTFPEETVAFAPVRVRYLRAVMQVAPPHGHFHDSPFLYNAPGAVPVAARLTKGNHSHGAHPGFHIHELVLHSIGTINQFEAKADFRVVPNDFKLDSHASVAPGTTIQPKNVVDLTARMKPDGMLNWTPPPGHWVVLRMGYSLEGTTNHPAPPAATGLEADKLSRTDVKAYMTHYLRLFRSILGPLGHKGSVTAFTTDSTEVGMQNWTPKIIQDFERLRGYNPIPWMPALTGVIVGNRAKSNKFLWDYRDTIKQLLATSHYREIQKVAAKAGLTTYGEALEDGRPSFGDDMQMRQYTDIPMGAMWMYPPNGKPDPTYVADLKGAASVAHIYGDKLVGAESLDSVDQPWAFGPQQLKRVVDKEFLLGVNRIVIHESAEQPVDKPPGFSLAFFGQMFNRLDAWAPEAGPWIRYISRCSYMLQQGHYAAQIAYFYGQSAPITGIFGKKRINVPRGYGFDFVNSNVLLNKLRVRDGHLSTQSGMAYSVLYLGGNSQWMTLKVLRRINTLVRDGATIIGKRPIGSPSLRGSSAAFARIAQKLFGPPGSDAIRHVGKGRVITERSLRRGLQLLHTKKEFKYSGSAKNARLRATERRLKSGYIFFVSNQGPKRQRLTASFDVTGYAPQIWNPVTGHIHPATYTMSHGRTAVPITLASYGAKFVVFRRTSPTRYVRVTKKTIRVLHTLRGPWHVDFERGLGAPPSVVLSHLGSWTKNHLPGVKYFSGTGTYTHTFRLTSSEIRGRIILSLGSVEELARVSVNGKYVSTLWTAPFSVNITKYVHPGTNALSIAVTNLWVNRLIGDTLPSAKHKYTYTIVPTYEANAPLRVSGLIGPVRIEQTMASPTR